MSEKKSNIKTLVLAIVAGVFAVSTVILSIMVISKASESSSLIQIISSKNEQISGLEKDKEHLRILAKNYCFMYVYKDPKKETFCMNQIDDDIEHWDEYSNSK